MHSTFTNEIADVICDRLACGESLNKICKHDDMPDKATVYRWLRLHKDFCDNYARAKEDQADTMADEILDIADDGENDTYTDDEGNIKVDNDAIQRSKLRVDTRKWIASKLKPKKYGDKQIIAGDPDAPMQANVSVQYID